MSRPYISPSLRRRVVEDAGHRCGYCLAEEAFMGMSLTIDHILPLAAGGSNKLENLWLACRQCNEYKQARTRVEDPETGELTPLFNPRTQQWIEHFHIDNDCIITGLTAVGRATVVALQLNRTILVAARRRWIFVGWNPLRE